MANDRLALGEIAQLAISQLSHCRSTVSWSPALPWPASSPALCKSSFIQCLHSALPLASYCFFSFPTSARNDCHMSQSFTEGHAVRARAGEQQAQRELVMVALQTCDPTQRTAAGTSGGSSTRQNHWCGDQQLRCLPADPLSAALRQAGQAACSSQLSSRPAQTQTAGRSGSPPRCLSANQQEQEQRRAGRQMR